MLNIRSFKQWFGVGQPRKRSTSQLGWGGSATAELLENRTVLSAVTVSPVSAEVGHVNLRKASVNYPPVAGNWAFTTDSFGNFNGTVTQKGAKFTINATAQGIDITLKGKFEKSNPTESHGKAVFSVPSFGKIHATYDGTTSPNGNSVSGVAHVNVMGQSMDVTITGTKL